MPLPDTLTGKWRCVCPKMHCWEWGRRVAVEREGEGTETVCWDCWEAGEFHVEPIILVRAEQTGSFDDREGQEFG